MRIKGALCGCHTCTGQSIRKLTISAAQARGLQGRLMTVEARDPAMSAGPPWQAWAPPLDPPTAGALSVDEAERIALAYWDQEPHLCAALLWESFAGPPAPDPHRGPGSHRVPVVSYSPPRPGGEYGTAIARAEWHRSFLGTLGSAPLVLRRW